MVCFAPNFQLPVSVNFSGPHSRQDGNMEAHWMEGWTDKTITE